MENPKAAKRVKAEKARTMPTQPAEKHEPLPGELTDEQLGQASGGLYSGQASGKRQ